MTDYKKYMFDNFVILEDVHQKDDVGIGDDVNINIEPTEKDKENEIVDIVFEEKPVVEKEPVVQVVSYSQEDLDVAARNAEEKGYEKGFNTAVSENEKLQTQLLENINNRLMTILADVSTQNVEQEQTALQFAVSMVKKILPNLEKEVAVKEVEAFIGENFESFAKEASLSFRFHPDIIGEIAPKISHFAEKNDFEGKIAVHKDANLSFSDCKIEWKNGRVERNVNHTISQVENLIDN